MKNLSILLLIVTIIYLIFSFISFNPLWVTESEYTGFRFMYLIGVFILYMLSRIK